MKSHIMWAHVIGCVALATSSHASIVQVRDAPGGSDPYNAPDGYMVAGLGSLIHGTTNGGPFETLGVGTFSLEADTGGGFQPLITYCIQPNEQMGFGLNPPDSVGLPYQTASLTDAGFSPEEAQQLGILWANAFDLSLTSQTNAAAFQAVIWEFTQDDGEHFFTSGNFSLDFNQSYTLDVILTARAWLDNIINGVWTNSVDLIALTNPNSQDFLMPVSVPGPGAMSVLAMGLIALRTSRRRV